MYINKKNQTVSFGFRDADFLKKHGPIAAADMALDFVNRTPLPFIHSTHQLADLLMLRHKDLHFLVRHIDKAYRPVTIKKKNGGNRHLRVPSTWLSGVQRTILDTFLKKLPISPYATAYHKGARLIDNAAPHCQKRYLLKMDLENFFGSIRFDQVYNAVFRLYPKQIAAMLTTLCCYQDVLPQGTPTSPALSNLVMRHFDDVMGTWCEKQGLSYTRYCDDITISGNKPLYVAYTKAKTMLENMGFELNQKKTHFITSGNRQTVTGLTVNDHPNISKDYRRRLRQEVHYLLKFGADDAIMQGNRTDFITCDGSPDSGRYIRHLIGQVQYVLSVCPNDAYFTSTLDSLLYEQYKYP